MKRLIFPMTRDVGDPARSRQYWWISALFALLALPQLLQGQGVRYDIPPILGNAGNTAVRFASAVTVQLCAGTVTPVNGSCSPQTQSFTSITLASTCPLGQPVTLPGSSTCQATSDGLGNAGFWLAPGAYIYCFPQAVVCYNLTVPVGATPGGNANLGANSLTVGTLITTRSDSIRQVNIANTQAWSGTDVGGWINSAASDVGSGRIHVAKGVYTFSTQINLDQLTGITVECDGGVTSGGAAATQFIWSGTGTPFSARSSTNIHVVNCQFMWTNAAFAGPVIDTSVTGSGCGGGGCDTTGFELDHVSFFKTGSGVNVPLVSLDKNINCSIHDSSFHNFASYAIRGAASSSSFANVCYIVHNIANTATGDSSGAFIRNPSQAWQATNNTLELGNASGTVSFVTADTGVVVTGFKALANWAGDQAGAATYILFDFSASGQGNVAGIDISGGNYFALNTNSTYLKLPNNSQAKFEGNTVTDCSKLLDLGTNDSIDIGSGNGFAGTCATFYGTNNPARGFGLNSALNPVVFGNVLFPSTLNTGAGTATTAAVGIGATNSGWFNNSNSRVQETAAGAIGPMVDSTGWFLGSGQLLKWGNAADPNAAGAFDLGLSRDAGGVLDAGNGTASDTSAKIQAAAYISKGSTFTASGCTNSALSGGAATGSFTVGQNTNCSITITMGNSATAPHGWTCTAYDETNAPTQAIRQTGHAPTTCTLNMTAATNDVIVFSAVGW